MPTVGTLNIDLRMGTAALMAGASKAASTISKMADSIKGSFVKMSMSLTPVVDVGSLIGSIKAIATAQSKFIDDTGKLADRLGISTESLVGLGHAADLAGVGFEEFGGMMVKLQKNLGKFADDEGKTQEVVEGLGISLRDLKGQDIDKTFLDITDAIAKTHDPLKRVELLTALFSKSGEKLANVMMAGKQSIREAMEEAKKLGMTFSRFEAAKVEAANDAFTRMKGAMAGIGNTLTIGLAPYFEVAFNKARDFVATHGQTLAKAFVSAAGSFVDALQKGYEISLRIASVIGEIVDSLGLTIAELGKRMDNPALIAAGNNLAATGIGMKMRFNDKANWAADDPRWSDKIKGANDAVAQAFMDGMKKNVFERMAIMAKRLGEDIAHVATANSWFSATVGRFFASVKENAAAAKKEATALEEMAKRRAAAAENRREFLRAADNQVRDAVKTPLQRWGETQQQLKDQAKRWQTGQDQADQIRRAAKVAQIAAAAGGIAVGAPGVAGLAAKAIGEGQKKIIEATIEAAGGITPTEYVKATLSNKKDLAAALGVGAAGPSPAASGAEFGTANAAAITAGSKMNYSGQTDAKKSLLDLVKIGWKQLAKQDQQANAAVEQLAELRQLAVVNF